MWAVASWRSYEIEAGYINEASLYLKLQCRTTSQHFAVYVSITATDKNSSFAAFHCILLSGLKIFWYEIFKEQEGILSDSLGADYLFPRIFKKCEDSYSLLHLHYSVFMIVKWRPLLSAVHLVSITENFLDTSDIYLIFVGRSTENTVFLPGNYLLNRISSVQMIFKEIKIMNDYKSVISILKPTYVLVDLYL